MIHSIKTAHSHPEFCKELDDLLKKHDIVDACLFFVTDKNLAQVSFSNVVYSRGGTMNPHIAHISINVMDYIREKSDNHDNAKNN